ncbi:DUF1697 domain-containing protein [Paenibacillus oenotherae]|uniref:DUF1697 domain-containing protein n=1 Tax=Paenibacillus oenotherae TaxID=1435645 RepID=A0ABS7DBY0_9BACL|nr:DUF1697 domain-containing protein [Paenibacillus oenotherae]MBW7477126.1 DUF1697 domain-containing protein [Paenibacillus oenotherae]
MGIYAALLRGINVSGQKIIKMDHLRAIFESLQFRQVRTYIQSGNVIFEAVEDDKGLLRTLIESKLKEVFGFDVTVVIRTHDELEESVRNNPYSSLELQKDERVYVSYLAAEPKAEAAEELLKFRNDIDDYEVIGREVYILSRKGYGKSLFSNNFLEKKLGVAATTRNWETVNKIAALCSELKSN